MQIPPSIQIAGLNIQVIVAPNMHKDTGMGGHSDYPNLRILIAGDLCAEMQQVSFIHEVMHFILFVMGEDQLRDNEKFVDLMAHLLHQSLFPKGTV